MKIIDLKMTTERWPTQWDAKTDDGKSLYIRFRHGYLSVEENRNIVLEKNFGENRFGGGMPEASLIKILLEEGFEFSSDIILRNFNEDPESNNPLINRLIGDVLVHITPHALASDIKVMVRDTINDFFKAHKDDLI